MIIYGINGIRTGTLEIEFGNSQFPLHSPWVVASAGKILSTNAQHLRHVHRMMQHQMGRLNAWVAYIRSPGWKKKQCRLLRNFISFSWLIKIRQREALKTNPHFPSSSDSNWERHQSSKSLRCPASPVSWQEKHLTSFWRAQINWTVWLCGLANVKGGGWKTQHFKKKGKRAVSFPKGLWSSLLTTRFALQHSNHLALHVTCLSSINVVGCLSTSSGHLIWPVL